MGEVFNFGELQELKQKYWCFFGSRWHGAILRDLQQTMGW